MDVFGFVQPPRGSPDGELAIDGHELVLRHRYLTEELRLPIDRIAAVGHNTGPTDGTDTPDSIHWLLLSATRAANIALIVRPAVRVQGFGPGAQRFFELTRQEQEHGTERHVVTMALQDPTAFTEALVRRGIPEFSTTRSAIEHVFGIADPVLLATERAARLHRARRALATLTVLTLLLAVGVAVISSSHPRAGSRGTSMITAGLVAVVAYVAISQLVPRWPAPQPFTDSAYRDAGALLACAVLFASVALLVLRPARHARPLVSSSVAGAAGGALGGAIIGYVHRLRRQVDITEQAPHDERT